MHLFCSLTHVDLTLIFLRQPWQARYHCATCLRDFLPKVSHVLCTTATLQCTLLAGAMQFCQYLECLFRVLLHNWYVREKNDSIFPQLMKLFHVLHVLHFTLLSIIKALT